MNNLGELMHEKFNLFGNLIALKCDDQQYTYREIHQSAQAIASAITNAVGTGKNIGIVGQKQHGIYAGLLGVVYSGNSFVPINPKFPKEKILKIVREANIHILVGTLASEALIQYIAEQCTIKGVIFPDIGEQPETTRGSIPLINTSKTNPTDSIAPRAPSDCAYVLFTSGSTGDPKGVVVTNQNIVSFLNNMQEIYDLDKGFIASQTFDLSFDPAVSDIFFTWFKGGILAVLPEEEMLCANEFILREKISYWNSVPTLANFMEKIGVLSPGCFPDLKYSMFCGEQLTQTIANKWLQAAPNSTLENLYGPTEATIYISRYVYGRNETDIHYHNGIVPIGKIFPNHAVAIISEDSSPLAQGKIGEIIFKGAQITEGYLNDRIKTDLAFVRLPWDSSGETWYKSGDLGFINTDGNIECIGRKDNQVKIGGRRVEIGEIEAVLRKIEITKDAVVVPYRDHNDIVQGLVAFTPKIISNEEILRVKADHKDSIENLFFPKHFIHIPTIPLLPSGKTDRKALGIKATEMNRGGAL